MDPRYPIGKFAPKETYSEAEVKDCIARIETLPERFKGVVEKLNARQLEMPYREQGWTARQVIHHVADSHMNAYIRTKWTLTEASPLIKAYNEKAWAETPDIKADPALSLALLKALHGRWVPLLKSLSPADLSKAFIHPETKQSVRLDRMIALYAWHGDHHLGHLHMILSAGS